MRCPLCNTDNPPGFSFCGRCGSPLPIACPQCGLENPPDFSFCGHCGTSLSRSAATSTPAPLEGERRFVVVLFADIAGFTRLSEQLDAEEATALVNRCLDEMTRAVVQQGGRIDKYTGDGLMAVFGAPIAHEDDPERTLRAALVMRQAVNELQLDLDIPQIAVHLGLACGQVVAAGVGGQGRREYTVIGTAVNLAARLEEASRPNQILVSEELARLTEHAFLFDPLMLPRLQGWKGQVPAFELHQERSEAPPSRWAGALRSPLVGRETELALLWRNLEELNSGKGGVVSVIGEAGVGKSRLLREAWSQACEQHLALRWLEGNVLAAGETLHYGCFRTLLRSAVGLPSQADPHQAAGELRSFLDRLMPEGSDEAYPYLGRLLGTPLLPEDNERLERMDGEQIKWQTVRVVQQWLLALTRQQPLVLVFEDLHLVDPASVELVEQLLPLTEQEALLVVGAFRPEADRAAWRLREAAGQRYAAIYTELWLRPLYQRAAEQMVNHLLHTGRVPQKALELILGRTEGNPLFIEEIVRSMIDQGILVCQEEQDWRLSPGWSKVNIPDTIQGILQARIDRLDVSAKRVLQVAACVGRRFSYRLLHDVVAQQGFSPQHLDRCLRTLEEAALVERKDGSPEGEYTFQHVLIRDTVHSSLLKGMRAQFHIAVARWYEENSQQTAELPYALLAYHYEQTEDFEKQRVAFTQAGRQAARSYSNSEARTFYSKALALTADPITRFALLLAREQVCLLMGDYVQQRADLEEALQLAQQANDYAKIATVYNQLSAWHESQSDYPAAHNAAEAALSAARQASDAVAEAESLHRIASNAWRQGRFHSALEAAKAALRVARAAHDTDREATSLTTMGIVHRSLGELEAAQACYQQALDLRRAAGDRRGEAISLSQLGNALYDQGNYSAAFEHHRQALDLFRTVGDRRGEAWSLNSLGTAYLVCGDFKAARTSFEEGLVIRRAIGDRRGESVAMADLGNTLVAAGEYEAARTHLEQALATLQEIGARRDEVYALSYLARLLEKTAETDAARTTQQTALTRRRERHQEAASMENAAGLARLALAQGDLASARAWADELLAYIDQHGLEHIESPFLVYQTGYRVLLASGETIAARRVLDECYRALMERAGRITDPLLRRSFLERIPEHAEIVHAWKEERE